MAILEPNFWQRNRVTLKGIAVGILILVLLIPTAFIYALILERKERQAEVVTEVSSKWAGSQTISGPFLIIPYNEQIKDKDGKPALERHNIYCMPESLTIDGVLVPEIRSRSIYEVVLYKTTLQIEGSFSSENFSVPGIDSSRLLLGEAQLCFGLTDNRGIEDQLSINWNGNQKAFAPGVPANTLVTTGVSVPVSLSGVNTNALYRFDANLKLKGSEYVFFTPLGKRTLVKLQSAWTNPSFDGKFLPTTNVVNDKGFVANWNVLHFNREFPQTWVDRQVDISASAFGINLLQPNDVYGKSLRAVKYAILFISLTFCLYFFIELFQKRSLHPMQYILVGLALCIFYTLLLSVSEYIHFNLAYLVASTATITLITLYTKSLFQKWNIALLFGIFLGLLYSFIFILIQLQDGALLFGSIGLFGLLALVMYYSRKIEWNYSSEVASKPISG